MLGQYSKVAVLLAGWVMPGAAGAELLRFDAVLETRVQEFVAGQAVSFDEAFEEFEVTSAELPLGVASNLVSALQVDTLVGAGRGLADFFEPRIAPGVNPAELGLEADSFSVVSEVAYQVTASVVETRRIRFSPLELPDAALTGRDVESSVFLSGAVFVWAREPGMDLTGVTGKVSAIIQQMPSPGATDGGEPGGETKTVFSASIGVRGRAGGVVEPLVDGRVAFVLGGPEVLLEAADADSSLDGYVEAMGVVHVLLVPDQEVRYRYRAHSDEEFQLQATFSVEVTNLPGGTGVSAVFGRSFESLAEMIDAAFFDVDGTAVQSAVNLAQAKAQAPPPAPAPAPLSAAATGRAPARLCGATGLATLGLSVLLLTPLRFRPPAGSRRPAARDCPAPRRPRRPGCPPRG